MPEVAEVAHACALLRRNVLGLTVRRAAFPVDNLLFPILKTAENPVDAIVENEKNLLGATITGVGRHGKYFWLRFETALLNPLVMLMHFGMTGRIRMRNVDSHMIFMENGGDKKVLQEKKADLLKIEDSGVDGDVKLETEDLEPEVWPPRFTKFELFLENRKSAPEQQVELAFLDPRRLARVRFLSGDEIINDTKLMQVPPLKSLGPDYSKSVDALETELAPDFQGDPDPHHHGRPRLTFEEFAPLVLSKKKPIKAFLLDQDFFAGIGNWVSDEILYQARIHPGEVLSKKIASTENPALRRLYDAIIYVMEESVRVEGNAKLFPDHWLMLHRWGKGRKEPRATTKTGHKVDFQTVGGRTSCFVPELQKPLVKEDMESELSTGRKTATPKKTIKAELEEVNLEESEQPQVKRPKRNGR